MIDLHTHTILSDGVLLPSELVRRAKVSGYEAIAITDHVDHSNIDAVLSGLIKVSKKLNKYWDVLVIPGVEITHAPLELFGELTRYARKKGAKIVVAHGESPAEPVLTGTNNAAINARVDILAHPGFILEHDACLAAEKGVYLEITARGGHRDGNKHVFDMASKTGAKMVVNTDSHAPGDLFTRESYKKLLLSLTDSEKIHSSIIDNSVEIVRVAKG
ncbi:MAG: histidinol phosphate phosphatase domain-containing protein [Candidatus Omnitrophota bacterium]